MRLMFLLLYFILYISYILSSNLEFKLLDQAMDYMNPDDLHGYFFHRGMDSFDYQLDRFKRYFQKEEEGKTDTTPQNLGKIDKLKTAIAIEFAQTLERIAQLGTRTINDLHNLWSGLTDLGELLSSIKDDGTYIRHTLRSSFKGRTSPRVRHLVEVYYCNETLKLYGLLRRTLGKVYPSIFENAEELPPDSCYFFKRSDALQSFNTYQRNTHYSYLPFPVIHQYEQNDERDEMEPVLDNSKKFTDKPFTSDTLQPFNDITSPNSNKSNSNVNAPFSQDNTGNKSHDPSSLNRINPLASENSSKPQKELPSNRNNQFAPTENTKYPQNGNASSQGQQNRNFPQQGQQNRNFPQNGNVGKEEEPSNIKGGSPDQTVRALPGTIKPNTVPNESQRAPFEESVPVKDHQSGLPIPGRDSLKETPLRRTLPGAESKAAPLGTFSPPPQRILSDREMAPAENQSNSMPHYQNAFERTSPGRKIIPKATTPGTSFPHSQGISNGMTPIERQLNPSVNPYQNALRRTPSNGLQSNTIPELQPIDNLDSPYRAPFSDDLMPTKRQLNSMSPYQDASRMMMPGELAPFSQDRSNIEYPYQNTLRGGISTDDMPSNTMYGMEDTLQKDLKQSAIFPSMNKMDSFQSTSNTSSSFNELGIDGQCPFHTETDASTCEEDCPNQNDSTESDFDNKDLDEYSNEELKEKKSKKIKKRERFVYGGYLNLWIKERGHGHRKRKGKKKDNIIKSELDYSYITPYGARLYFNRLLLKGAINSKIYGSGSGSLNANGSGQFSISGQMAGNTNEKVMNESKIFKTTTYSSPYTESSIQFGGYSSTSPNMAYTYSTPVQKQIVISRYTGATPTRLVVQ